MGNKRPCKFYEKEFKSKFDFQGFDVYNAVINKEAREKKEDLGYEMKLPNYTQKTILGDWVIFYPDSLKGSLKEILNKATQEQGGEKMEEIKKDQEKPIQENNIKERLIAECNERIKLEDEEIEETKAFLIAYAKFKKNLLKSEDGINEYFKLIQSFGETDDRLKGNLINEIVNENFENESKARNLLNAVVSGWENSRILAFDSMRIIYNILGLEQGDYKKLEGKMAESFSSTRKNIKEEKKGMKKNKHNDYEIDNNGMVVEKHKKGSVKKKVICTIAILGGIGLLGGAAQHIVLPEIMNKEAEKAIEQVAGGDIKDIGFTNSIDDCFYFYGLAQTDKKFQIYSINAGEVKYKNLAKNNEDNLNRVNSFNFHNILDNLDTTDVVLGEQINIEGSSIGDTAFEDGNYFVVTTKKTETEPSKTFIIGNGKIYTGSVSEDTTVTRENLIYSGSTKDIVACLQKEKSEIDQKTTSEEIAKQEEENAELERMTKKLIENEILEKNETVSGVIQIGDEKYCKCGDRLFIVKEQDDNIELLGNFISADKYQADFSEKICEKAGCAEAGKEGKIKAYVYCNHSNVNGNYKTSLDLLLLNADDASVASYDDIYQVKADKAFTMSEMTKYFYNTISEIENTENATYIYNQGMLEK